MSRSKSQHKRYYQQTVFAIRFATAEQAKKANWINGNWIERYAFCSRDDTTIEQLEILAYDKDKRVKSVARSSWHRRSMVTNYDQLQTITIL